MAELSQKESSNRRFVIEYTNNCFEEYLLRSLFLWSHWALNKEDHRKKGGTLHLIGINFNGNDEL